METFRVEVGHVNQVKPGNLVGAIANETGIQGAAVGRIEIYDEYSTVDLPVGMPSEMFYSLKKVWVAGRQLNISRHNQHPGPATPRRPFAAGKINKPKKPKKKHAGKSL